MNIDGQALFEILNELYPRELEHALAELRARQAEQRLAELEDQAQADEGVD